VPTGCRQARKYSTDVLGGNRPGRRSAARFRAACRVPGSLV